LRANKRNVRGSTFEVGFSEEEEKEEQAYEDAFQNPIPNLERRRISVFNVEPRTSNVEIRRPHATSNFERRTSIPFPTTSRRASGRGHA
jgi:hypothetical protein